MKKTFALLSILALLAMPACTTTPTGQSTVDPVVLQAISHEAAAVGATLDLAARPQDRGPMQLAQTSLKALIAAGSGNPADLQAALSSLPIAQLKGTQGAVIVAGAVTIIDAAGKQLATMDKAQVYNSYVLPVAKGVLAGLDQALGTQ